MTGTSDTGPAPLAPGDARVALDVLAAGGDWKAALEELLAAVPPERSEPLMLLLREGRAAWAVLLERTEGRALFWGNALSGTPVALGHLGFDVTVTDPEPERIALARARAEALAPGRLLHVEPGWPGPQARLPFPAAHFDLVVCEAGHPAPPATRPPEAELARVSAGELVLISDNRLGYKRSLGVRGEFRVPGPVEYARRALAPEHGERTLLGWRRSLARAGLRPIRAHALYPHSGEFAQVASLERSGPRLFVGPLEQRNRAKVWAQRAGLVPWLTPSYAFLCGGAGQAVLERALAELAERLDEPLPEVEHLVATRGNVAVVHTRVPGRGEDDPAGRWTLHVPLGPRTVEQTERHARRLETLRARFPDFPAPRLLLRGTCAGLWLTCERRLPGLSAAQVRSETVTARILAQCSVELAKLVESEPRTVDDELFERFLGSKIDLVARFARVPSSVRALARLRDRVRERTLGRPLRLAHVQHADLRSKHVQVRDDGALVGFLDWGSSAAPDLPWFDLLNLVAQGRKQAENAPPARAWEVARDPRQLRPGERAALDDHARRIGLDPDVRAALDLGFPAWVGAQAERTWDYSRPLWIHRQYAPERVLGTAGDETPPSPARGRNY